jgi:hypothetical protein
MRQILSLSFEAKGALRKAIQVLYRFQISPHNKFRRAWNRIRKTLQEADNRAFVQTTVMENSIKK